MVLFAFAFSLCLPVSPAVPDLFPYKTDAACQIQIRFIFYYSLLLPLQSLKMLGLQYNKPVDEDKMTGRCRLTGSYSITGRYNPADRVRVTDRRRLPDIDRVTGKFLVRQTGTVRQTDMT